MFMGPLFVEPRGTGKKAQVAGSGQEHEGQENGAKGDGENGSFSVPLAQPSLSRLRSNFAPNPTGALTLPLTIGRSHGCEILTMRCSTE